jgi:hypothetical protein
MQSVTEGLIVSRQLLSVKHKDERVTVKGLLQDSCISSSLRITYDMQNLKASFV